MKVIKKGEADLNKEVVKLEIKPVKSPRAGNRNKAGSNQSLQEGGKIIEDAKKAAEGIRRQAEKKGKEEGFKQGYRDGRKKGLEEFEHALKQLGNVKEELEDYKEEIIREAEPEIVRLAQYIAEKVVRQAVNDQDAIITSCLNFALKQVVGLDEIIIKLNPEDYGYLTANKQEIEDILERFKEIKFIDDQRVEKGGCIIETKNGNIDAQPSSQLKIANRLIEEEINSSQGD